MGERKSLVFDKCLTAVRVKDGEEKNGERANGRGDDGACAQGKSESAQNSGANEGASLRNERVNFKSDAQKDASSGLNLSENAKAARAAQVPNKMRKTARTKFQIYTRARRVLAQV